MSSKQENTSQKCTKNQSKEKTLKDRIDRIEGICLDAVSRLCEANYDDGCHPVVGRVIKQLRSVYMGDWD